MNILNVDVFRNQVIEYFKDYHAAASESSQPLLTAIENDNIKFQENINDLIYQIKELRLNSNEKLLSELKILSEEIKVCLSKKPSSIKKHQKITLVLQEKIKHTRMFVDGYFEHIKYFNRSDLDDLRLCCIRLLKKNV